MVNEIARASSIKYLRVLVQMVYSESLEQLCCVLKVAMESHERRDSITRQDDIVCIVLQPEAR